MAGSLSPGSEMVSVGGTNDFHYFPGGAIPGTRYILSEPLKPRKNTLVSFSEKGQERPRKIRQDHSKEKMVKDKENRCFTDHFSQ